MADNKITHLTGNVGAAPKVFQQGDVNVLKISLGVTLRYGEDKETRWVNCSIWEDKLPELFAWAQENVSSGTPLAVEGTLRTDRYYNEKQQFDLRVSRIGLVTWAKRNNSGEQRQQAPKAEPKAETVGAEW